MKRAGRIAIAIACAAAALGLGAVSMRRVQSQFAATRICDAATARDWEGALAAVPDAPRAGPGTQEAAECLCWAWSATGRVAECAAHLDALLGADADWLPEPGLLRLVLRTRIGEGRHADAVPLAQRATAAHPQDPALLDLELTSRAAFESEVDLLAELGARVLGADGSGHSGSSDAARATRAAHGGNGTIEQRLVLARAHDRHADYAGVLAVLGEVAPDPAHSAQESWFEARASALGASGDAASLRAHYAVWAEQGADPSELRARYALRLSQFGLQDPRATREQLLRAAIADEPTLAQQRPDIVRTLYERLIGRLIIDRRGAEALEVWDRAAERFEDLPVSRAEVLRAAESGRMAPTAQPSGGRELAFVFPPGSPSGELSVSPPAGEPPDAPWQRLAVSGEGQVRVERTLAVHPLRWVFRDAAGRTRASGTLWPETNGISTTVRIGPPALPAPLTPFTPTRPPADGRPQVFVLIPDCEDWRLVQYLRERGELPVHDWLFASGWRAVLRSTPPFTGAAMEFLVRPDGQRRVTFAGVANQLGVEVAGLASVGRNPLGFLSPWLPHSNDLFDSVGAGPHVAQNLLFTHGHIEAGRHARRIGPRGLRRDAPLLRASRALAGEERADLPRELTAPRYRAELRKLAAELDAAVELARAGDVDLVMLRLEPVDILTHGFYSQLVRPGQDDGGGALLWVYRYVDRRIGELIEALDADDTLILVSDHGIRTALEHEEDAIFVAVGPDVPVGRAAGQPHLRGVPRVVAGLLGLQRDWPDTGIAPWLAARAARP